MVADPLEVFAKNLRVAREAAGMTQEELALAAGLNMANVSRYEGAKREPGVRVVVRLAQALGVTPGSLLDEPSAGLSSH
ncbi:helix-turn-helix transcriptional regulator [Svornostia abyssi]|uniref:Helix-turn-helix transcriptional regulator n=1 Tax=Svornostia abyssi TaxID=2898438 RepID=A0ABY5PAV2_9ACTN|nr:helix-turn-helix transcriptional regulator [Parviterribacteraceae bacterium J379]